ncbi:hypothetical protein AOL_s00112g1 [Orbilia oligospora ATCC 24927]|uniref:F-box domain-containing protein n=1 Tax=Arthrobotrys oligospora (strain ATCC 24927 / CBS 115.81 / DSM 1491) TaxID=756982 RepID=G1XLH1_ARTOA|nr:hypothetical protein AOL_s00112g1 [Orbilia oligospora ATCC 24927]EGX45984.1 hypothetical protein AOL_s00112g1 [Orbilia oligospora ATCC 24927]
MTTTPYIPLPPTITSLILIPPILDCIVTYLYTLDLLSLSSTSLTIRAHLLSSHAAWRAISFYTPTRPLEQCRYEENVTSVFASTIAVRSRHISPRTLSPVGGDGDDDIDDNNIDKKYILGDNKETDNKKKKKKDRYLSIDTTLTILARSLPSLSMYTSIDLSRTLADKYLLRDLIDNCSGLRYLRIEDCPKVRIADLVVGLYGVEKKVLKGIGKGGGVSFVAEVMGRTRVVGGTNTTNTISGINGGGGGGEGKLLSRLTHIHTKEVRDGLYRLNELRDGVRGEIVRVMSRMEDVYEYPELPPVEIILDIKEVVRKTVGLKLREIRIGGTTDLKLNRSSYNGTGWLERLAYSQGDYLWVLCGLLGVLLVEI